MTAPLDPMAEAVEADADAVTCYMVLSLIHYRYRNLRPDDHMRLLVEEAMDAASRLQATLARPSEDGRRLDTTNLRERLADAYVLRESSNPTVAKLAELCRDAHDVLAAINAGAGQ